MLDAFLSSIGSLGGTNGIRYMPNKNDPQLLRLLRRREVTVPRDERLDLDEIDALCMQLIDDPPSIRRTSNRCGARKARRRPIEHRTSDDHARTEKTAGSNLRPPPLEYLDVTTHVAHTGDPVHDEHRQSHPLVGREPVAESRVHMHVPQTGHEVLALSLDDLRLLRRLHLTGLADLDNALAVHYDGHIRQSLATARVDHGYMS